MPYQRDTHYLDESLQAVLSLNCVKCPSEVARILVNLCGAVRALERENEALFFALSKIENGRPDPDEIEASPQPDASQAGIMSLDKKAAAHLLASLERAEKAAAREEARVKQQAEMETDLREAAARAKEAEQQSGASLRLAS